MTIEIQVNQLKSQVTSLDSALVNISDRMDQLDEQNLLVQNFFTAKRVGDEHLDLIDEMGLKISSKIQTSASVNYPTGIKVFKEGQPTVISYYQRLAQYTEEFTINEIYPHTYKNPTAANSGVGYSFGFDIDINGEGNFAICSYARHICRVYGNDGKHLFDIGKPASAGHVKDGKLYYPIKPLFLPNGNILIVSYYGFGTDATQHGHISEYSGADGKFIKTRLGFYGDGQSQIGTNIIYRPMGMDIDKKDPNLLWVTEYTRGRVVVINMKTWLIEDIYYPPSDYSFTNAYGLACLSDGNFAIASNVQASILIIDRQTKELIKELDVTKIGAAPDFRDCKELKPGFLIFTSWTSRGAFVIPTTDKIDISYEQYDLPTDISLISDVQMPGYNPETKILTRRINDLDDVPDKIAVPYNRLLP